MSGMADLEAEEMEQATGQSEQLSDSSDQKLTKIVREF